MAIYRAEVHWPDTTIDTIEVGQRFRGKLVEDILSYATATGGATKLIIQFIEGDSKNGQNREAIIYNTPYVTFYKDDTGVKQQSKKNVKT